MSYLNIEVAILAHKSWNLSSYVFEISLCPSDLMFRKHSLNYFTSTEKVVFQRSETFNTRGKNSVLCVVQTTERMDVIMV